MSRTQYRFKRAFFLLIYPQLFGRRASGRPHGRPQPLNVPNTFNVSNSLPSQIRFLFRLFRGLSKEAAVDTAVHIADATVTKRSRDDHGIISNTLPFQAHYRSQTRVFS